MYGARSIGHKHAVLVLCLDEENSQTVSQLEYTNQGLFAEFLGQEVDRREHSP